MSPTNQPPAVTGTLLNEELADLLTASRNGSLQNLDKKFDALAIKIEAIYDASERTATSMNILVTLMAAQVGISRVEAAAHRKAAVEGIAEAVLAAK